MKRRMLAIFMALVFVVSGVLMTYQVIVEMRNDIIAQRNETLTEVANSVDNSIRKLFNRYQESLRHLVERPGFADAEKFLDKDGNPVLIGCTCDLPRIKRFVNAIESQKRNGTIVGFEYQKDALGSLCPERIHFQDISFEKWERNFFHES